MIIREILVLFCTVKILKFGNVVGIYCFVELKVYLIDTFFLGTYSNLYNHPQLIKYQPKVSHGILRFLKYTVQETKLQIFSK
jgi:hypothetical protein